MVFFIQKYLCVYGSYKNTCSTGLFVVEVQGALSKRSGRLPRLCHSVVVLEEIQICDNPQLRFTEIDEDAVIGDGIGGKVHQFDSVMLQNLGKEGVNWQPESAFDICEENKKISIFVAWRMPSGC